MFFFCQFCQQVVDTRKDQKSAQKFKESSVGKISFAAKMSDTRFSMNSDDMLPFLVHRIAGLLEELKVKRQQDKA